MRKRKQRAPELPSPLKDVAAIRAASAAVNHVLARPDATPGEINAAIEAAVTAAVASTNEAMTEKDAARYIGMSRHYLQQDRSKGATGGKTPGPAFCKVGWRVIYLKSDLDAWLRIHRVARARAG